MKCDGCGLPFDFCMCDPRDLYPFDADDVSPEPDYPGGYEYEQQEYDHGDF